MSTPLDLATPLAAAPTGMESSLNTMTNFTYSFQGGSYVCDDARQNG